MCDSEYLNLRWSIGRYVLMIPLLSAMGSSCANEDLTPNTYSPIVQDFLPLETLVVSVR